MRLGRDPFTSVSTNGERNNGRIPNKCAGADVVHELRVDRVIKDISFVRIALQEISFPQQNATVTRLLERKALFGFILDYAFPCTEGVSPVLAQRIRLNAKEYSSTGIVFKMKRVVPIRLTPECVSCWQRAELMMHLSIQVDTQGKFAVRPLASCRIPLSELVIPPFLISRDFLFIGQGFEGTALIRIDLGSKSRTLMEKLEEARGIETPILDSGGAPRHTGGPPQRARSRSSSRCRSRGEDENRSPPAPLRRRRPSSVSSLPVFTAHPPTAHSSPQRLSRSSARSVLTVSDHPSLDDDVFLPPPPPRVPVDDVGMPSSRNRGHARSADIVEIGAEPAVRPRKSTIRLTIHGARDLPPVVDERGQLVPPNALISVRGRDGELRSFPVQSTNPAWEWSAQFVVSGERQNLVIKLLHHDVVRGDRGLGFVSLQLPLRTQSHCEHEVVDLMASTRHGSPSLVLSAEQLPESRVPSVLVNPEVPDIGHFTRTKRASEPYRDRELGSRTGGNDTRSTTETRSTSRGSQVELGEALLRRPASPRILGTREEIEDKLRRHMSELDDLMKRIPKR